MTEWITQTWDEKVAELLQEGYGNFAPRPDPNAMIDGVGIDMGVVEETPCPECGGPMQYEPFSMTGSYRAFAVCQNGHWFEF